MLNYYTDIWYMLKHVQLTQTEQHNSSIIKLLTSSTFPSQAWQQLTGSLAENQLTVIGQLTDETTCKLDDLWTCQFADW